MRKTVRITGETDTLERDQRLLAAFRLRKRRQAEAHIVDDRKMRKQREILENQPYGAFFRRQERIWSGNFAVVERHATRCLRLNARRDSEQGRLAGTRRPKQAQHFTGFCRQRNAAQRYRVRPVAVTDILERKPRSEGDAGGNALGQLCFALHRPVPSAPRIGAPNGSIILHAGSQQAELFQVDIGQLIFVLGETVRIGRRLRYAEVGRHARRQEPRSLEFVDTGEVT